MDKGFKYDNMYMHNGKEIHLGYFADINESIKSRKEAEIKYKFHDNHGRDWENDNG